MEAFTFIYICNVQSPNKSLVRCVSLTKSLFLPNTDLINQAWVELEEMENTPGP